MVSQRAIGRSPIGGLEFIGSVREFMEGKSERSRDAVGDIPCGVSDATLNAAYGRRVEVSDIGEGLLGQAHLLAAQTNRPSERDMGALADPHPWNPVWLRKC